MTLVSYNLRKLALLTGAGITKYVKKTDTI